MVTVATETQRYFTVYSSTARHQQQDRKNMSDFIISFYLFGEFDNFEDWDAAEEKERREYEKKKEKRHKEVTPEELNELEDDKDEISTKKTTKWAVKTSLWHLMCGTPGSRWVSGGGLKGRTMEI